MLLVVAHAILLQPPPPATTHNIATLLTQHSALFYFCHCTNLTSLTPHICLFNSSSTSTSLVSSYYCINTHHISLSFSSHQTPLVISTRTRTSHPPAYHCGLHLHLAESMNPHTSPPLCGTNHPCTFQISSSSSSSSPDCFQFLVRRGAEAQRGPRA